MVSRAFPKFFYLSCPFAPLSSSRPSLRRRADAANGRWPTYAEGTNGQPIPHTLLPCCWHATGLFSESVWRVHVGATCHGRPSRWTCETWQACVAGDEQPATPYWNAHGRSKGGKKLPFQTKGPQKNPLSTLAVTTLIPAALGADLIPDQPTVCLSTCTVLVLGYMYNVLIIACAELQLGSQSLCLAPSGLEPVPAFLLVLARSLLSSRFPLPSALLSFLPFFSFLSSFPRFNPPDHFLFFVSSLASISLLFFFSPREEKDSR